MNKTPVLIESPLLLYLFLMTIDKDSASPTVVDHEDVVPKAESVTSPMDHKGKMSFRQAGAVLAILVCYAMVGINITLLSPSLTRIADDLGYLVGRQWIVTSYMISYLTTMPISGKVHITTYLAQANSIKRHVLYSYQISLEGKWSLIANKYSF